MDITTRARLPSMNIHHTQTAISVTDPLRYFFRSVFSALPASARGHVVAVLGELIGTIFFIFFAFAGAQVGSAASNKKQGPGVSTATDDKSPSQLLYIALSAGFSLVVFAWTFFRISGGLFNPVISLGMALIGAITWARCALLCIAQTVGTIIAAYLVYVLFRGGLNVSTELGGGTSPAQGVIIEMLLTAQLAFTIFMLAAEKHAGTFLAPIGIGLSLFIAELVGVFWTGGSLNPARSLAPCIVNNSFTSYHWIYWVGPIAGSILAVLLYKLIKALEYESVNGEESEPILPQSKPDSTKHSSVVALTSIHSNHSSPNSIRRNNGKSDEPAKNQPSPNAIAQESKNEKNDKNGRVSFQMGHPAERGVDGSFERDVMNELESGYQKTQYVRSEDSEAKSRYLRLQ